jgi:hypothetical protein
MKPWFNLKYVRISACGLAYVAGLTFAQTSSAELCGSVFTSGGDKIRYCRDKAVSLKDDKVTRAVIIIHGHPSDAKSAYDALLADRNNEGIGSEITIIAPHFLESKEELDENNLGDEYEYYKGVRWAYGAEALNSDKKSSFTWMDKIILELLENKPNLKHITVAGISGGGQFINHYSAFTNINATLSDKNIGINYIVSAPSLYLYLSSTRPDKNCDDCNDYPHGLDSRNSYNYVNDTSNATAERRILTRNIDYATGKNDTGGWTGDAEMAQGKNRIDRMRNYKDHLHDQCQGSHFPPILFCGIQSSFIEVPNVAHEWKVFDDAAVRKLLFK